MNYPSIPKDDFDFILHMTSYMGNTVTVFTESGGLSGSGFTGVLISVTPSIISIMTALPSPPVSPFSCHKDYETPIPYPPNKILGSIADIPVDKIVAFVHHAV